MNTKKAGAGAPTVKKDKFDLDALYSGDFKIEKGVPIPGYYRGKPYEPAFPWLKMKVGDSFPVKANGVPIDKVKKVLHASLSYMKKQKDYKEKAAGYKQAIREIKGGVRVWRVN